VEQFIYLRVISRIEIENMYMYINGKMIPVETIPEMGREGG
jgi:hypothetical protein